MTENKKTEKNPKIAKSGISGADYSFQSHQKTICPLFRLRAKAVKEVDPKFFTTKEIDIVKTALLAQDMIDTAHQTGLAHIFEERGGMWGDIDSDKLCAMGKSYGFSAETLSQPELLISLDLARGFIRDRRKGIIDDSGNIVKPDKLAESTVMKIPHLENKKAPNTARTVMSSVTNLNAISRAKLSR